MADMKKRILSLILALQMAATLLPTSVWAEGESTAAAEPAISAEEPVETPEPVAAAADVPDDVEEAEAAEIPAETTPEPSDDPQADKPARTDTVPPEYLSPEEIQASATGEYEEVGGMMIDTGTGKDKYQTDPVPEGKPIPVEPEDVEIGGTAS